MSKFGYHLKNKFGYHKKLKFGKMNGRVIQYQFGKKQRLNIN